MSTDASPRIVLKNTFLEFAIQDEASFQECASRRRSVPPRLRFDDPAQQGRSAAQLARLGAIMMAERSSGLDSAPGQEKALASPAWSAATASPAGSPTLASPFGTHDGIDASAPGGERGGALELLSLGSRGHAGGTCRPCAFARSATGCKFGAECQFCHVVAEHPESVRVRPCKGKRERHKRQLAAIEKAVAADPGVLATGAIALPSLVGRNDTARSRVMEHLAEVATQARRAHALGRGREAVGAQV